MRTTANDTARDWVDTDPAAIRDDVHRLGLDEAVSYNMDLIQERISDGDVRWLDITEDALCTAIERVADDNRRYTVVIRCQSGMGGIVTDGWTDQIGVNEPRSLEECRQDREGLLESGVFDGLGPDDIRIWDEHTKWFADE